jgi:hypothetical protein
MMKQKFRSTALPKYLVINLFLLALFMPFANATNKANATTSLKTENCPSQQVTFQAHTIFDEQEQGSLFFHRWANALHIKTKQITLKNEAAFFFKICNKDEEDLAELERHLRNRKYIRDALVTSDKEIKRINVETWDNWSLMPTINFGRKGGVNTYSFGIKDRNLLGLGIDAQLQSFTNVQRSGYKFETQIPLYLKLNTELNLRISDNNDGKQNAAFVTKTFASFTTPYAYNVGFNSEKRNDTIFQNDDTLTIFKQQINFQTASFAWLSSRFNHYLKNKDDTLRFSIGLTKNQHRFTSLEQENVIENTLTTNTNIALPQNRDFSYPWFSVEYIEQDFKKLTNVHLVTQIEDFNFGWQASAKLGIADGKKLNSAWALWRSTLSKGFAIDDNSLALFNFSFASDIYDNGNNRIYAQFDAELFYHLSEKWNFYASNTTIVSKNQYFDQPITLGGDTDMRGFPLQYQHGDNSTKFTSELRYYPKINLYKLFELAGAAFIDLGKTSGRSPIANIDKGWLYSIGIGARIYSAHSSLGRVVHIDLARPFSDNPELGGFEIRIQAKETF